MSWAKEPGIRVREENSQCNYQAVDAQRFHERKTQAVLPAITPTAPGFVAQGGRFKAAGWKPSVPRSTRQLRARYLPALCSSVMAFAPSSTKNVPRWLYPSLSPALVGNTASNMVDTTSDRVDHPSNAKVRKEGGERTLVIHGEHTIDNLEAAKAQRGIHTGTQPPIPG